MSQPYNQFRAMQAISKASFIAIMRSPSTVIFSIFFPLIFILVFGFIGNSGGPSYRVVLDAKSDTLNPVLDSLKQYANVRFVSYTDGEELRSDLAKGRITGVLDIQKQAVPGSPTHYRVGFRSTTASSDKVATFLPLLENIVTRIDKATYHDRPSIAIVSPDIREVRQYRTIDFILPGQLGFSLLSAGVFGVAFLFYSLREQLVLKRFYATPIKRSYIILGEGLSRVVFQLLTAVIIIAIGHYAFQFTLVHGWITFLEIMILSFIALLVFMGFGFIVSGLAPNQGAIPPLANIVTLPQFLLAGTFFPIDAFPKWLQPISLAMPLTYFNDAMRKIAFEGVSLAACGTELAVLLGWGVLVYAVAVKVFRWE